MADDIWDYLLLVVKIVLFLGIAWVLLALYTTAGIEDSACKAIGFEEYGGKLAEVGMCEDSEGDMHYVKMDCDFHFISADCTAKEISVGDVRVARGD